jgi:hypothetical protein
MKRWGLLLGIVLTFSIGASAQEENPKVEVFRGYSYVRANAGFGIPGINMNGRMRTNGSDLWATLVATMLEISAA